MIWAAAIFVVVAFLVLVRALGVPARAAEVGTRTRDVLATVRDPELDDSDKERAMRSHAGGMLVLFAKLTGASAVALAVPVGAVWLLEVAGVVELSAVLDATLSWPVLLGATVLGFAVFLIPVRREQ